MTRRVVRVVKTCAACGRAWTPKRRHAKTCSDACRQRLRRSALTVSGQPAVTVSGREAVRLDTEARERLRRLVDAKRRQEIEERRERDRLIFREAA